MRKEKEELWHAVEQLKLHQMVGPLTSSPPVDGHIMKKASKAFGSAPRAERQKM